MTLLRTALQKLAPKAPEVTPVSPAPLPDPTRYRELAQLCAQRQLLTVMPSEHRRSYQGMILALDIERELLWLDDLFPRCSLLTPGDKLTISHHKAGDILRFEAIIVALGRQVGTSGMALALPAPPRYRPRRQWPRLAMDGRAPVRVKLALPGAGPQYGQLLNISAGGLRLALPGNWLTTLRHGDQLPLCELTPTPGLTIRCRARLCAFNTGYRPWRQTYISLAFVGLDGAVQQNLHHWIVAAMGSQLGLRAA